MKRLLLGLLLLGVAACQDTAPTLEATAPGSVLAGPAWKLVAYFDTYDGLWHSPATTRTEQVLRFSADGTFVEEIVGGPRHPGTWRFDATTSTLTLHYTDGYNHDLAYTVRALRPEVLELERMGRHGPVIERYQPR